MISVSVMCVILPVSYTHLSACSTGEQKASHVQLAIGNAGHQAYEAIRFTLGIQNTPEELDDTVEVLKQCVKKLRDLKK